jgi:hypothetical protein
VYSVATLAVALLLATLWLFKRRRRQGRQAGMICLVLSIALHVALIFLVPLLPAFNGGNTAVDRQTDDAGIDSISFSTFDPDMEFDDAAGKSEVAAVAPLPVYDLMQLVDQPIEEPVEPTEDSINETLSEVIDQPIPEMLADRPPPTESLDSQLDEMLDAAFDQPEPEPIQQTPFAAAVQTKQPTPTAMASAKTVPGELENDFANRTGSAKQKAINSTGGDANTEAAVEAALRFLVAAQRPDGAWDPRASGAGVERSPLGLSRGAAGARAESAITGLSLLTLLGAGHTHQKGEFSDNVYRGLVYLMQQQKPDGSLAGNAAVYASTYSHGMAALAVCESAAITSDPAAIQTAKRAIAHTRRMQHPTTGGWRYLQGDPGDLSQLGWQAMVLDAGYRAKLPIDPQSVNGVHRFLRTVRMGTHGGLAAYRPGERASPTMTAEALATRLLLGQKVPAAEIAEAEQYLLQHLPGQGQDNYYYWYYATLALHQLQDNAWTRWNQALKQRLLATQQPDGSWSSDTLWGGYGGTVYTTSMAALCLETYYRHAIRADQDRLANQPGVTPNFR